MRFKRIFLIFALAIFMLAGVAWAEDDDDQGENDDSYSRPPIITWYGINLQSMILEIEVDFSQAPDDVCVTLDDNRLQLSQVIDDVLVFELPQEPPRDTWVKICVAEDCGDDDGQSGCEWLVIPSQSEEGHPILSISGPYVEMIIDDPYSSTPSAERAKKNGRTTVRALDW